MSASQSPEPCEERVTIVVASRNRQEALVASLARHRELPERPRVIVVDDASDDGTARVVGDVLEPDDVIRLPRSLGGAARNAGVRAADSPYVALTDDDAWWSPGALRRACDLLDGDPRLAVVQPHVLVGARERDDPTCIEMASSDLPRAPGQVGEPILSFIACAVVVRRSAFL